MPSLAAPGGPIQDLNGEYLAKVSSLTFLTIWWSSLAGFLEVPCQICLLAGDRYDSPLYVEHIRGFHDPVIS